MAISAKKWETYEEVTAYILNQLAEELGLLRVETKQSVAGLKTGTEWEIDAKGILSEKGAFVIIECRRYTKAKLAQEDIGGLAFRILDTGAFSGIIVTPLGLQEGAEKVAKSQNIITAVLNPESTTEQYMVAFLDKVFAGMTEKATCTETTNLQVVITASESGKITETAQVIVLDA